MNNFPVPSEAVEAGLLASVDQNLERWWALQEFTSDDFTSHRDIFLHMGQYFNEYRNLPSNSQLSARFDWQPPIGDFAYWMKEMKRFVMARKVTEVITEGYNRIHEPEEALGTMLQKLSLLRSMGSNHVEATDAGAMTRIGYFDVRTEQIYTAHRILGIPSGCQVINDSMIGWIPGSLVGAYARPGVGKTWWLMNEGVIAWMNNLRVLCIAPEMPANMLNLRIDVIAGNHLGYPLDYNQVLQGNPAVRERYHHVADLMSQSNRWWTYDSLNDRPISLGDISTLIRQHEPDIVLIDGISLLRSESRGQMWEKMFELCYGAKNLATIHELPIIVTHQAVNSRRGNRGETTTVGRGDDFHMPSLNDAAYGDSFVQACSDVITFCAEPTSPNVNWYSIRKHRERGWANPLPSRMGLAVDFVHGRIIDLSRLGYDPAAVGEEARRVLGL